MAQPSRNVFAIAEAAACAALAVAIIFTVALFVGNGIALLIQPQRPEPFELWFFGPLGLFFLVLLLGGFGALASGTLVGLPVAYWLDRSGRTKRWHFILAGGIAGLPAPLWHAVARQSRDVDFAYGWGVTSLVMACLIGGMIAGYVYWRRIYGAVQNAQPSRSSKPLGRESE
jgi:hypothetical protein